MLMETIAGDGEQSPTESRMRLRESKWVTIEKGKQGEWHFGILRVSAAFWTMHADNNNDVKDLSSGMRANAWENYTECEM